MNEPALTGRVLPAQLPTELRFRLLRFHRGRLFWRAIDDLSRLGLIVGSLIVIGGAFDRLVDVPGIWRLPFPWLTGAVLAGLAGRLIWRLLQRPDFDEVAHRLDRARRDSRDHLRSALDFSRRGIPEQSFERLSEQEALDLWRNTPARWFVERKTAVRWLTGAVAFAIAVVIVSLIPEVRAGLLWQRFLNPLGNYMRPTATWFEVEAPPSEPVPGGDDYRIRARLRGRPLAEPVPLARVWQGDGPSLSRRLKAEDTGGWQLALQDLRRDVQFELFLGPIRSARHTLRVLPRPTIEQVVVSYEYPNYSRLPRRAETLTGRTITALEGTKVKLEVRANVPLAEARGTVGEDRQDFLIDNADPRRAVRYHYVTRNELVELHLRAVNGLESRKELPFNIRVIPDQPPIINLTANWGNRAFYAREVIEVGYRAQDDIGLAEVTLRAGPEDYMQDADVERHGAREAQGILKVPVARLVQPGVAEVELRMLALDTKGQLTASQAVTLRIAVNSYDRQLRHARHSLVGIVHTRDLSQLGYPMLAWHRDRLQDLHSLQAKLTILQETLAENTAPGPNQEGVLREIRSLLANLDTELRRVIPEYSFPEITVPFDWMATAPLTPRLQQIVRDSVCTAALAVSGAALRQAVEQALASPNPKGQLAAAAVAVVAAAEQQDQVVARLQAGHQIIQTELAGYLAASTQLALSNATDREWADHDFLLNQRANVRELAELDPAIAEELKSALEEKDDRALLEKAEPLLPATVRRLVAAAHEIARSGAAHPLAVPTPATPNGRDLFALWLIMQADDEDADELEGLESALRYLHLAGGNSSPYRPMADTRQHATFRQYAVLSRLRAGCEALRLGLVSGAMKPGQPEFEALWIALREGALAMEQWPAPAPEEAALVSKLAPLQEWIPAERSAGTLAAQLDQWEVDSGRLAAARLPELQAVLRDVARKLSERRSDLLPALADYRRDIAAKIEQLKTVEGHSDPREIPGLISVGVPRMRVRLAALQAAVLPLLAVEEAARLHQASQATDERLLLARAFLDKAADHLTRKVGQMVVFRVNEGPEVIQHAWKGKIKTYQEFDAIVADLSALLTDPGPAPDKLREYLLSAAFERERQAMLTAVGVEASLRDRESTLRSLSADRQSAAAVWGGICYELFRLRDAWQAGQAMRTSPSLTAAITQLGALPREVEVLPDVLAGPASGAVSPQRLEDLGALLTETQALARPPAPTAESEQEQRDWLRVNRSRVALLLGPPEASRAPLYWALSELEWNRRKQRAAEQQVGIGGLFLAVELEMENLKLPRYLYLELKRAREQGMPELFKDRSYNYLNAIMEAAR